jgi:hypothetical protein
MRDLRRFYPPDREVLRGINLSFYPGAKIGVIGPTGRASPRCCGSWPLDPAKDVVGNVADGVAEASDLLDRFNEVCAAMADPTPTSTLLSRAGRPAGRRSTPPGPWDLERTSRSPWTPCAAAARRRRRPRSRAASAAAWRCAGCCCPSPTCCCSTSRPTTSTPSRWPGSSAPAGLPGGTWSRHPRPLLPRQRGRLDPRARPRPRHPLGGQLLVVAGAEAGASPRRRPTGRASARSSASSSGSACRRAPARAKGKARISAYNELVAEAEREARADKRRDRHPARPAARRRGHRTRAPGRRASATGC